jgi:hypothetical protein
MFKSRKDQDSKNLNRVVIQVGAQQTNKDLLDFVVYHDGVEYTIGELFEKVLKTEDDNQKLRKAIKIYEDANNDTTTLITKAAELLSKKVVQLEDEVATLKNKCKYL